MAEDQYNEDDFSYERDIAPMNRRYFERVQSLGLSAGPSASLLRQQRASSDALFERESKIRQIEAERQTSLLQREKAFLDLENGRRKTQQELVQMEQLRPIQEVLSNINNNAPPEQREPLIRQFGINYAGAIESNPAAKFAYENALQAAKPVEDKDSMTIGKLAEKGVSPDFFNQFAKASKIDPMQLRADMKVSPYVASIALEDVAKNKQRQEELERTSTEARAFEKNQLDFLTKAIQSTKLKVDKYDPEVDEFEDPTAAGLVSSYVTAFGTQAQKEQFTKSKKASEKLGLAKTIVAEQALRLTAPPRRSVTSLYE